MGPTPGGSSKGGSSMPRGSGSGGFGNFGGAQTDPYAFRLDPVYRKLRYEIGCAMKGLRGTDEFRPGVSKEGLYKVSPLTKEETEYLKRAGEALRDVAAKLKVKSDELDTKAFVVDKLALDKLTALTNEVAVKAKPKAAGPELKDPLSEPDPADEPSPEAEKPAAKTTAAAAAGKAAK